MFRNTIFTLFFSQIFADESYLLKDGNKNSEATLDNLRNVTIQGFTPLLGGPSTRSTTDCGFTSGKFPDIPPGYYTQLGCSGPFKKQDIKLSVTTSSSYNNVVICPGASDDECNSANPLLQKCYATSSPSFTYTASCASGRCCLFILCANAINTCGGSRTMSYDSTFAFTFLDSILAGIVVGSVALLVCCCAGCYCCCCRRKKKADESTVEWGGSKTGQQQFQGQYQGPPPQYQGQYQGPPPPVVYQQQYSISQPQIYQTQQPQQQQYTSHQAYQESSQQMKGFPQRGPIWERRDQ